MRIRAATGQDLPAILEIYNHVVLNTTAIYDERVSTLQERQSWFEARSKQGFPVLVLELDGQTVGFSSFGEWRSRWGYRHTVEHSVHVRADCRGRGFGRALIEVLFPYAAAMGMHRMIAHLDAEASASLRLHEKLGFEMVGTFSEVGHVKGRWVSVVAMQRAI
jgi:L-amino acid N-acyltransferase